LGSIPGPVIALLEGMAHEHSALLNTLTFPIVGAAIEVHRRLGPGLLESVYARCLQVELQLRGLPIETEKIVTLTYRDIEMGAAFRLDLVVDGKIIVEVKAVEHLAPIHEAQLITYLKLTGCPAGLLLNFNVPVLKDGLRRLVNPAVLATWGP
jgi:GxxExxY protein